MGEHDKDRGLYGKFVVTRTDGSSNAGGKHVDCDYFVLDMTHDKFAGTAMLAYADACEAEYPKLAADLRVKAKTTPYDLCFFVRYTEIKNVVFVNIITENDLEAFEKTLGEAITWGDNDRTMVSQEAFFLALRHCDWESPESPNVEMVVEAIKKLCGNSKTYIDMEN